MSDHAPSNVVLFPMPRHRPAPGSHHAPGPLVTITPRAFTRAIGVALALMILVIGAGLAYKAMTAPLDCAHFELREPPMSGHVPECAP